MKHKCYHSLILYLLLFSFIASDSIGQITKLDSIIISVNRERNDSIKILKLSKISKDYLKRNIDTAYILCKQAMDIAEKYEDEYCYAMALRQMGSVYKYKSEYTKALLHFQKAYSIFTKLNLSSERASVLNRIGNIHKRLGEYEKSLEYFQLGLQIYEEIKDTLKMTAVLNNMGALYMRMLRYDESLELYHKSLDLTNKLKTRGYTPTILMNIGNIYKHKVDYNKAMDYYKKALFLLKDDKDKFLKLQLTHNIGTVYEQEEIYDTATQYYSKAIKMESELGEKSMLVFSIQGLGNVYVKTGKLNEGIELLHKSYGLAKEIKDPSKQKRLAMSLANAYERKGDYKKTLEYYKLYHSMSDSLFSEKMNEQISEMEVRYETEKKEQQIELQETKLAQQTIEIKQQKLQKNSLIGGLSAVTIVVILLGYAYDQKKRSNIKIREQNREIEKQAEDLKESNFILQQQALSAQINPHFIFNTLNSIQYFIYENNKEASNKYLNRFSKLMRLVLDNSQQQAVLIKKELEALELYLDLELLRFENKFEYSINCDDETLGYRIPALLIQPFVENAILHGISNKNNGKGKIDITIESENEILLCSIDDNGIGRNAAREIRKQRKGLHQSLGTQITEKRLDITGNLYNKEMQVKYIDKCDDDGNPEGTRVEITLPIII